MSRPSTPAPVEAVAAHAGDGLDDTAPFPTGFKGEVTYALHWGTLPYGLSIDPGTGEVAGATTGSAIVDVSATEAGVTRGTLAPFVRPA